MLTQTKATEGSNSSDILPFSPSVCSQAASRYDLIPFLTRPEY